MLPIVTVQATMTSYNFLHFLGGNSDCWGLGGGGIPVPPPLPLCMKPTTRYLGLWRLCQHNFWNNRKFLEAGIMRE